MKLAMDNERRSFKPPFLMLAVLGAHVVAAAVFVTMSGCQTKRPVAVEVAPPPAPVLPPGVEPTPPVAPAPRPAIRPPVAVEPMPSADEAPVYFVQKGDSLSKIAKNAGVSAAEIAELNRISDPNKIRVGQRLLLPVHARSLPSTPPPAAKPAAPAKPAAASTPVTDSGDTHTVRAGDTLTKIANRYNTSVNALLELNNLKRDSIIKVGQKIKLPSGTSGGGSAPATARSTPPVAPAPKPAAAPAPAPAPIVPAPEPVIQPVIIDEVPPPAPALVAPESSSAEAPFPYTVKEGDTLDSIAIKFSARKDVIMGLNNLSDDDVRPGQRILIPWQ
jgi:LysM repeat protein